MPHFPSLSNDALVADVYPMNPKLFKPWCEVEEGIMRWPSAFSPGEREMMGAYCSKLNSCSYCYSSHSEAAIAFGLDRDLVEALMEDVETAPIDPKMKPVLAYLKKLTLTPSRIVQADADAVFDAGWDEKALHEAIMVCCCYAYMNRLADGHGLPSDPSMFKARGRRHMENGYVAQYAKETASDDD